MNLKIMKKEKRKKKKEKRKKKIEMKLSLTLLTWRRNSKLSRGGVTQN